MIGFNLGLVLGIIAIVLLLLGLFCPCKEKEVEEVVSAPEKAAEVKLEKPAPVVAEKAAPVKLEESAAVLPDDLKIVEGIGPKIERLLNDKGIFTFAQLAAADVAFLEQVLRENALQFAKPHSWPVQAELAAAGKMEELKALQEKLTAGRL